MGKIVWALAHLTSEENEMSDMVSRDCEMHLDQSVSSLH